MNIYYRYSLILSSPMTYFYKLLKLTPRTEFSKLLKAFPVIESTLCFTDILILFLLGFSKDPNLLHSCFTFTLTIFPPTPIPCKKHILGPACQ